MDKAIKDRLDRIKGISLKHGSHKSLGDGACAMEMVSFLAGEPWSDAPQCACPVITAFLVSWNDALPSDAERDRLLKDLIPAIIGTRATKDVEKRRSYLALDWLIRVFTPKWLDLVPDLNENSKTLRELDAITDFAGAVAAGIKTKAAESAAWSAARSAVESAAESAAWSAARSAARSAVESAACGALKPTTALLQASALRLVREMIAVKAKHQQ